MRALPLHSVAVLPNYRVRLGIPLFQLCRAMWKGFYLSVLPSLPPSSSLLLGLTGIMFSLLYSYHSSVCLLSGIVFRLPSAYLQTLLSDCLSSLIECALRTLIAEINWFFVCMTDQEQRTLISDVFREIFL